MKALLLKTFIFIVLLASFLLPKASDLTAKLDANTEDDCLPKDDGEICMIT